MTQPNLVDRVRSGIQAEQRLQLGTEYPKTFKRYFPDFPPPIVWSGKSEGMIAYYQDRPRRPLAVFGLVDSGRTLAANGLVIIEDEIEQVFLQEVRTRPATQYFDDKSSITARTMVS